MLVLNSQALQEKQTRSRATTARRATRRTYRHKLIFSGVRSIFPDADDTPDGLEDPVSSGYIPVDEVSPDMLAAGYLEEQDDRDLRVYDGCGSDAGADPLDILIAREEEEAQLANFSIDGDQATADQVLAYGDAEYVDEEPPHPSCEAIVVRYVGGTVESTSRSRLKERAAKNGGASGNNESAIVRDSHGKRYGFFEKFVDARNAHGKRYSAPEELVDDATKKPRHCFFAGRPKINSQKMLEIHRRLIRGADFHDEYYGRFFLPKTYSSVPNANCFAVWY